MSEDKRNTPKNTNLRINFGYLGLLIFSFVNLSLSFAEPLSLSDCINLALKQSESLKISAEDIKLAEARYREALSDIYPDVRFAIDQRLRDNDQFGRLDGDGNDNDLSGSGSQSSLGRTQTEGVLRISQPIFTGFREILESRAVAKEKESFEYSLRRKEELLGLDVTVIFFQLLLYRADLNVYGDTDKILNQRIKDLREFVSLGKARESEVLAAQSELAELQVLIERTRRAQAITLNLLAFLIGRSVRDAELHKGTPNFKELSLEQALLSAQNRPDIISAQSQIEANQFLLKSSRREYWPTLRLEGNGYAIDDPDRNRDWDLLFRFEVPVFQGGRIKAKVDQKSSELFIAELRREELRRVAAREIQIAFEDYQGAKRERDLIELLTQTARKNLSFQEADYKLGVVTNLDILSSIRQLQESERRLKSVELQIALELARLRTFAGEPLL